jgi:hypothetical protein
MKLKCLLLTLCILASGASALAADKPVDVRDVMTASQFHATGLDKLSPQEMAAFNAWLARYSPAPAAGTAAAVTAAAPSAPVAAAVAPVPVPVPTPTAATPAPADATNLFGHEMLSPKERKEPERIETRILGTFTGWNGRTVFTLENGQVWKQADSSTYETKLENPTVVIKRLGFGYLMTLTGHGATVFVTRVH